MQKILLFGSIAQRKKGKISVSFLKVPFFPKKSLTVVSHDKSTLKCINIPTWNKCIGISCAWEDVWYYGSLFYLFLSMLVQVTSAHISQWMASICINLDFVQSVVHCIAISPVGVIF